MAAQLSDEIISVATSKSAVLVNTIVHYPVDTTTTRNESPPRTDRPPSTTISASVGEKADADGVRSVLRRMMTRQYAADFANSWFCFAVALVFTHPLDTLRVRRQTHRQSIKHTLTRDGPRSLYRGVATPLIANGPAIANCFALNEVFRTLLRATTTAADLPADAPLPMAQLLAAGGMAGVCITAYSSPMELLRVQQQVAGRKAHVGARSFSAIASEIAANHPGGLIRGLYRGWSHCAVCSGGGRMMYFAVYEQLRDNSRMRSVTTVGGVLPNAFHSVCAATLASWSGWLLVFPFDVVKARYMGDGWASAGSSMAAAGKVSVRRYPRLRDCWRATYREGGVRAFTLGLPTTMVRSIFSSGISLPMYDALKPYAREAVGA